MEPGGPSASPQLSDAELRWKLEQPTEEGAAYEAIVTDAADAAVPVPAAAATVEPAVAPPPRPGGDVAAAAAGPSAIPKASSEDDIILHGKRVHVHGDLAKNTAHPPQHAPRNLNYGAVAREEIHDVAMHPPPVTLVPGHKSGVEAWDKVNSPKAHREM